MRSNASGAKHMMLFFPSHDFDHGSRYWAVAGFNAGASAHFYISKLPQIETAPQKIETKLLQIETDPPQIDTELPQIETEMLQIKTFFSSNRHKSIPNYYKS